MKKIIKVISLFLIIVVFGEVSYASEYLNNVEFTQKRMDENITWSGREWITDKYPPRISKNAIEFTDIEENKAVKNRLQNSRYIYVWTGNDYLVYRSDHDYKGYDKQKYLYRLSADFQQILNTYEIPNWINYMEFVDDKIFIATENVFPSVSDGRVLGINSSEFEIYYSYDCDEWTKVDYEDNYYIDMHKVNNKLLIDNYLYSDGDFDKVIYETHYLKPTYKVGEFLCEEDKKNEKKTEDNTVLAFSNDGVYFIYQVIDKKMEGVQDIFVVGDEIVIEDYRYYYTCNKEEVFSQLREKLPNNPVYVKFNDDILGFDEPPIIEDGSTLVPMRFLFEQMGADVEWDSETQTATATIENKAVTFSIDNVNARINNKPAKMDVPARLVNGKTMVPLRFLSENMGYDVDWDADSRTAIVNS